MVIDDEAGSTLTLVELSELLIGDASSESYYATLRLMEADIGKTFFRSSGKDGPAYVARPVAEVSSLRAQLEAAAEAETAARVFQARVDAAVAGAAPFALDEESAGVQEDFAALRAFACRARQEDPDKEARPTDDAARALLMRLGRKATAESGRQLLTALGVWSVHENLDLLRLGVPTGFSFPLLDEAERLLAHPPEDADAARRRDLTHLLALAIDEASTVEVDDALSVELLEDGGMRLWVHIADPSRYVEKGSPLEVEARRRGVSLYLPTGTVPMFPMELAAGPLSLSGGTTAAALSFGVLIDGDGGLDTSAPPLITPSLVSVRRLTYAEVDALFDEADALAAGAFEADASRTEGAPAGALDEPTTELLRRLEYLSARRLAWRVAGGSMERLAPEGLPDMSIKAREDPDAPDGWDVQVRVGGARAGGVARRIVTEAMLAAGDAAAHYGVAHGVPLPFRAQAMRDEPSEEELADCPEGPCRAWLAIRQMLKSTVREQPQAHEGLGLDQYVQVTSPIRRHADLAVHYQLKAHLRGEPLPYPADEGGTKSEIVRLAAAASSSPTLGLERSANAYWLAEFFKRHAGVQHGALVLGRDARRSEAHKLLLPGLGAIVEVKSSTPLPLGSEVMVAPNRLGELELV